MFKVYTGHPGSMCTGHANSCLEMLERLTGMVMAGSSLPYDAISSQLSMGIDIIIHITRNKEGKRYIDEISEVLPSKGKDFILTKLFDCKGGGKLEKNVSDDVLTRIAQYSY